MKQPEVSTASRILHLEAFNGSYVNPGAYTAVGGMANFHISSSSG